MNDTELTKQLDDLFKEWEKRDPAFVKDGLMLKVDDSESVSWSTSKLRIMFFVKDQNQGEGEHWSEDSREWIRKKPEEILKTRFFKNLANLLYGLCHIGIEDCQQVWYGELNPDSVRSHFHVFPFAFVEGKKEPGCSRISDKDLEERLNRDKDYLRREIEILNPNVIVCCGGPLFDFAINLYGKDTLKKYGINGNLRYSEEHNTILIYSEHPAVIGSYEKFYDVCMNLYRDFIKTPEGRNFYRLTHA